MFAGGGGHGVAVHPALDVRSESSRCTVKNDRGRVKTQLRFYRLRGWARVLRVVDQIEIDRILRSNLKFLRAQKYVQFAPEKGRLALNGQYPDRSHEFLNAENIDDTPQVISQHMQTHFRTHMFEGLHQEVR